MVKKPIKNKLQMFLEKHKKKVITYNLIIWMIFVILMLMYSNKSRNLVSYEELREQVNKQCDNNITLPPEGTKFAVRFKEDTIFGLTYCYVLDEKGNIIDGEEPKFIINKSKTEIDYNLLILNYSRGVENE